MIAFLRGTVADALPQSLVVDVNGVGYEVTVPLSTFDQLNPVIGQGIMLKIHMHVRETSQVLYGFATKLERELFRHLISVSGVGGNTARMILSTYSTSELRNIIATENAVLLKNVKGLGLKTAQKIIVELSGKMLELGAERDMSPVVTGSQNNEVLDETLAALVMLGFQKGASEKVVKAILNESPSISVEEAVRQALRRL